MSTHLAIDLSRPPGERWLVLAPLRGAIHDLVRCYVEELGPIPDRTQTLRAIRDAYVPKEAVEEMASIARLADLTEDDILLANVYFDAIKHLMGCTAFSVDGPEGPLHARNLDWPSPHALLERHTTVFDFFRGGPQPLYRTVGWPGMVGCFSGVAPGRFAVTLNAVSSGDPAGFGMPVTLRLRHALETADSFARAVEELRTVALPCDCLLLVTGVRRGEMAVIERTPTRAEVRSPASGWIAVTNDYRLLDGGVSALGEGVLAETTCGRYEAVREFVGRSVPGNAEECFRILNDAEVRMDITVQQMVFRAATGEVWSRAVGGA